MKNTVIALSALAGTALSTPLVTGLDFAQINAVVATAVTTGAPVLPTSTAYAQAAAVSEASDEVTDPVTTALKVKRWWWWNYQTSSSTSTSCTTTTTSRASTSTAVTTATSTSATSTAATSTSTSSSTTVEAAATTVGPYCTALPTGSGPVPSPDTDSAFLSYSAFHSSASAAAAPTGVPANYNLNFTDLNGATQLSTYLTYKTLDTYNAKSCADFCDATSLCTGFNIYFERDPSKDGNTGDCLSADLASTTNIKCALFGSSVSKDSATNAGQWRNNFHVVITGSNGYNKAPAVVSPPDCNKGSKNSGWKSGSKCGGSGMMVKSGNLIGQRFFSGPFDPSLCAAYAEAQVALNQKAASWWNLWTYQPCNSFNAVALIKNKITVGTYCSLFNVDVSSNTCSYNGGKSGSDSFEISFSFNYALKTYDNGRRS
ncbi:hypothetical protein GTA08_BOTSDO11651 [Botryosphaeria dothidea]|uniref:Carbohydrate-binding-like protein n=1 Tax=Botryosphaeria dothidea TaxID=55169 RepID=A0A8H4NF23_9PEZI|nr:hypothetical protein GTA08_BOTSDO11651 [Botryosphaeria dothidea]